MMVSNHVTSHSTMRTDSESVSPKSGTHHRTDSNDSTDEIDCIAPTREFLKAAHPGHGKMSFSPL